MGRIPFRVLDEIFERADGLCEACGWPFLMHAIHHRHPRGRGGSKLPWIDTAVNLMVVHGGITGGCHNLNQHSIHQNPTRSYRVGHSVHYGTDPATVEVQIVDMSLRA